MGALVLARRGSDWRSLAASENQLHALTEMGVEVSGEITRGEASDLLSLEATRRDLLPPTTGSCGRCGTEGSTLQRPSRSGRR